MSRVEPTTFELHGRTLSTDLLHPETHKDNTNRKGKLINRRDEKNCVIKAANVLANSFAGKL